MFIQFCYLQRLDHPASAVVLNCLHVNSFFALSPGLNCPRFASPLPRPLLNPSGVAGRWEVSWAVTAATVPGENHQSAGAYMLHQGQNRIQSLLCSPRTRRSSPDRRKLKINQFRLRRSRRFFRRSTYIPRRPMA